MSNLPSTSNSLFPSIGEIVTDTNNLPEVPDDDVRLQDDKVHEQAEGEEREVQQIESLCMNCHAQVSIEVSEFQGVELIRIIGYY